MNWSEKSGAVVCGWLLESYNGMRAGQASFRALNTTDSRRAFMQFIPAASPGAHSLRDSWERAERLSGHHLLEVYESGETEVDGTRVIYCAQEPVDGTVGEVLSDRFLEPEEARAMSLGVATALEYLHEVGLGHGAIASSNLFLVGDDVKLGVDSLTPASEPERRSDLVQLGNLLVSSFGADQAATLPAPFGEIAAECLRGDSTCSASNVLRRLEPADGTKPALLPRLTPKVWVLAASGVVAALALAAFLMSGSNETPLPLEPVSTAAAADKPSPSVPFGATPRAALVSSTPRGDADRVSTSNSTAKTWAVIAATYNDYDAAQKRATRIAGAARDLTAGVYPPKGQGARYYVVLGSGLTQQEAEDLLTRARRAGAPGDSYVTKLATNRQ